MATTSEVVARIRKAVLGAAAGGLLRWFLPVNPAPASRPRVTRWGGVYYGKTYERFRTESQPIANRFDGVPTDKPVFVVMDCVVEKPKTGKLEHPKGDVDNFAKGPLDVMTKAERFWRDDTQVVGLLVTKRYAAKNEKAGVDLSWFPV